MPEVVDTELLVNCTILAVNRFELNTIVNASAIPNLNRSEVVTLLSDIIENRDDLDNINSANLILLLPMAWKIEGNSVAFDKNAITVNENTDFETAMEATGFGLFNWLLHLMAIPAAFGSTFESSCMSFILPIAECDLKLSLYDKGILNATGYAGMIASAILWGYLADTRGRKMVLWVGFLLDAISTFLSGLSQNFTFLVILKFMGGVFVNGPTATMYTYISELHGKKYRSRSILFLGVWTALANLVLPLLAWGIFPRDWSFILFNSLKISEWQIFLFVSGIPSLITTFFFIYLPESPKFLMSQGRNLEALQVFQKIYALNTHKSKDSYPIKRLVEEIPSRENDLKVHRSFLTALQDGMRQIKPILTKPYVGYALHAFSMQFCIFLGLNTIRLWLPQLFASTAEYESFQNSSSEISMCAVLEYSVNSSAAQTSQDFATNCLEPMKNNATLDIYTNNIIVAASGMVGYIFAIYAIKILGNKGLCTWGLLISGVLGMSLYWSSSSQSTLIIASVFITISSISTNSLLSVVIALFPTSLRSLIVSMALMWGRTGGLTGNILFPYFMQMGCLPPFIFVSGMLLCAALLSSILPKVKKDMI